MLKSFVCYLHRPGEMTPQVRVFTCEDEGFLPQAFLTQMRAWPVCDVIEVYDAEGAPILRFTADGRSAH